MSWSWKIGRIAGIPIYVHWTFLILIAWVIFAAWGRSGGDVAETAGAVGFVLAIFGCIVLHEMGHALAARRYGVPTADITLLPIGGVARLQRIPEHPAEELVVAVAGPLVNVAIAVVLFLLGYRLPMDTDADFLVQGPFLGRLMFFNIFVVLFNLLPAFPMDGGRILRSLLAMVLDYVRATRIAASVGQFMAILFGFLGLMGNPFLLLIALFVWIGAEAEAVQVQQRSLMKDVSVREAMLTDFQTLEPTDTLGHATDLLLAGSQQDFPVAVDGRLGGVLTRDVLFAELAKGGREASVGEAPLRELPSVEAGSMLVPAVTRLREERLPCLQVVEQGRPVGLLTAENIGEFLMVRTALGGSEG